MKPLLWDSNEIDPFTGQPFTWDSPNPNVTWDGILEPGDAGYVPPPLPAADAGAGLPAVVPVKPGALTRIFSLVQVMQEATSYVESIGTDLGTIGSEASGPDFETLRPVFTVKMIGGKVVIDWGWGGFRSFLDMLQIQVDRADAKGFVDLAFDTTPGYTDTQPLPAAPVKWKYRAIWRVGDEQIGLWSEEVSITVGG